MAVSCFSLAHLPLGDASREGWDVRLLEVQPTSPMLHEETPKFICRENEACFCICLCAFSLVATLIASSLITASPEQDWTVLMSSFVPDQLTYLELFDFLPLSP